MAGEPQAVSPPAPPVTAIVLAAGMSRRMGDSNKLLLPVGGQAMVRAVALQALQACEQVVVVLGHEARQVRAALADLPVVFVRNPDYAEGMGTSVGAGAHMTPPGHAALVCLGDMPGVTAPMMQALAQAGASGAAACRPVYEGKPGNPVWWAPGQVAALRGLSGDEGGRAMLAALREQGLLREVPVTAPAVLWDIDTPQAWQAACDGA
jgi:CTP:molybdopterin cytidylyltransferase MocA